MINKKSAISKLAAISVATIVVIVVVFGGYLASTSVLGTSVGTSSTVIPLTSAHPSLNLTSSSYPTSTTTLTTTTAVQQTSTSSSISSTSSSGSSSTGSPSNLRLEIDLNSTEIKYGNGISGEVELFNTLPENLTLGVNYSNDKNIGAWDSDDFLCNQSSVEELFGFAVYSGHYTALNISQANSPLVLIPPVAIPCPAANYYEPYVSEVVFSPESNYANILLNETYGLVKNLTLNAVLNATTKNCENTSNAPNETTTVNGTVSTYTSEQASFSCGPTNSLYGYWIPPTNETCFGMTNMNGTITSDLNAPPCDVIPFPVGSYTILAEDLWNQLAYAYFNVEPD